MLRSERCAPRCGEEGRVRTLIREERKERGGRGHAPTVAADVEEGREEEAVVVHEANGYTLRLSASSPTGYSGVGFGEGGVYTAFIVRDGVREMVGERFGSAVDAAVAVAKASASCSGAEETDDEGALPPSSADPLFACSTCGRRFGTRSNLKKHTEQVHVGTRPFGCSTCGRRFKTSWNRNRHEDQACIARRRGVVEEAQGGQREGEEDARPSHGKRGGEAGGDAPEKRAQRGRWRDDEDAMQIALALSRSMVDGGVSDTRNARADRRCSRAQPCHGTCMSGGFAFVGAPRSRAEPSEPDGGWGYTPCCGSPVHFACTERWLNRDLSTGSGDKTNRTCPFCRSMLSRSSTRMLYQQAPIRG